MIAVWPYQVAAHTTTRSLTTLHTPCLLEESDLQTVPISPWLTPHHAMQWTGYTTLVLGLASKVLDSTYP